MKTRSSYRRFFLLPIALFFVTIMLIASGSRIMTESRRFQLNRLDKGWSFSDGNTTLEDVTLSTLKLGPTHRGQVITISNTLDKKNLTAPALLVISKMAILDVYIDDEKIYSAGQYYYDSGLIVPKDYHFIPLPDTTSQHRLRLVYTICDKNALSSLETPYFGTKHDIIKDFLEVRRLPIFVGGFLIIYSWILFSLGIYLLLTKRPNTSMFFSSAMATLLGLYTFTYNDIFCLLGNNDYFYNIMDYMTLYMIPLAIIVLFYSTHPKIAPKRQLLCLNLNTLFPIAVLVINHLKVMPINRFLLPFQLISLVEILIMLPPLLSGLYREHQE